MSSENEDLSKIESITKVSTAENGNLELLEATEKNVEDLEEEEDDDEESDDDDFFASLTPEQIRIIKAKQDMLKNSYTSFSKKQENDNINELVSGFGLTEEEGKVALEFCNGDEIECKRRLTEDTEFIDGVRDTLYYQKMPKSKSSGKRSSTRSPSKPVDVTAKVKIQINLDAAENVDLSNVTPRTGSKGDQGVPEGLGDIEMIIRLQAEKSKKKKAEAGLKQNGEKRAKNIRLSDALSLLKEKKQKESFSDGQKESSENVKSKTTVKPELEDGVDCVTVDEITYTRTDLKALGWSDARIKSFLSINKNPNSFYYRFNAPGEEQRTGEWSKEEVDLFMDLIKDGCNYRWGEFSMSFKGRVGYQCSNFYRKLIQDGVIKDPNYVYLDGKLKFLGKDGKRFSRKQEEAERKLKAKEERERRKRLREEERAISGSAPKRKKSKKKKRSRRRGEEIIRASNCESSSDGSDSESEEDEARGNELIKGLKCPMTMGVVRNPCLSPYGHIMGYDTWLRILNKPPRNTCPFTNQKLTRRMLVKLDQDNIALHHEAIKKIKPDFDLAQVLGSSKS